MLTSSKGANEHGLKGFRLSLGKLVVNSIFGATMACLTIIYAFLIIVILAFEDEIYDSKSAIDTINITEIVLASIFGIEAILIFIAFGLKVFFSDKFNIIQLILILTTIVWTSLDISDSGKFRVMGAYRLYRVFLLYVRLYHTKILHEARKTANKGLNDSKTSLQRLFNILLYLQQNIKDTNLCNELRNGINFLKTVSLYPSDQPKEEKRQEDNLCWARTNTISLNKRKSDELHKSLHDRLENYDIEKLLSLNGYTKEILEQCQEFEFDIFALERETNGNEMIVCATYLLYRHDLFANLSIDPNTFNKFISSIQDGYNDVAYHNKIHGMDVGRLAYYY